MEFQGEDQRKVHPFFKEKYINRNLDDKKHNILKKWGRTYEKNICCNDSWVIIVSELDAACSCSMVIQSRTKHRYCYYDRGASIAENRCGYQWFFLHFLVFNRNGELQCKTTTTRQQWKYDVAYEWYIGE